LSAPVVALDRVGRPGLVCALVRLSVVAAKLQRIPLHLCRGRPRRLHGPGDARRQGPALRCRRHHRPRRDPPATRSLPLAARHSPAVGPEGNENARSLVMAVRHAGHTLLLTGDLEGPGLTRVLKLAPEPADILMAPHHGSPAANPPALAQWSCAKLVISSQGK